MRNTLILSLVSAVTLFSAYSGAVPSGTESSDGGYPETGNSDVATESNTETAVATVGETVSSETFAAVDASVPIDTWEPTVVDGGFASSVGTMPVPSTEPSTSLPSRVDAGGWTEVNASSSGGETDTAPPPTDTASSDSTATLGTDPASLGTTATLDTSSSLETSPTDATSTGSGETSVNDSETTRPLESETYNRSEPSVSDTGASGEMVDAGADAGVGGGSPGDDGCDCRVAGKSGSRASGLSGLLLGGLALACMYRRRQSRH